MNVTRIVRFISLFISHAYYMVIYLLLKDEYEWTSVIPRHQLINRQTIFFCFLAENYMCI